MYLLFITWTLEINVFVNFPGSFIVIEFNYSIEY